MNVTNSNNIDNVIGNDIPEEYILYENIIIQLQAYGISMTECCALIQILQIMNTTKNLPEIPLQKIQLILQILNTTNKNYH